jgi:tRNA 2-selenouridine synthase
VDISKRGELKEAIRILLTEYYDPMYKYGQNKYGKFILSIESDNIEDISEKIVGFIDKY